MTAPLVVEMQAPAWAGDRSIDELVKLGGRSRPIPSIAELVAWVERQRQVANVACDAALTALADPVAADVFKHVETFRRTFPGCIIPEDLGACLVSVPWYIRQAEAILSWAGERPAECPGTCGAPVQRGEDLCWHCQAAEDAAGEQEGTVQS